MGREADACGDDQKSDRRCDRCGHRPDTPRAEYGLDTPHLLALDFLRDMRISLVRRRGTVNQRAEDAVLRIGTRKEVRRIRRRRASCGFWSRPAFGIPLDMMQPPIFIDLLKIIARPR